MRLIFVLLFVNFYIYARTVTTWDDDYFITKKDEKLQIIYPKEFNKYIQKVDSFERDVIKEYSKSYGYKLDKLYLGIISSKNQIANAFSTQIPFNLQMDFSAGFVMVDYMASKSWIKELLLHESSHNFQLNPKKNPLSKVAYKIVKNAPFTSLFGFPIFPVPNFLESSFMLEGNAVFNESRFANGGRLYNGGLLALAITQAKAGLITPKRTYNNHLYFPYGTHNYIVGGFFQLFLAKRYGIDKVNRYFWNYSGQYIPIQTSAIFTKTFGKDYKKLLSEYSDWLIHKYDSFKKSSAKVVATSKINMRLNSNQHEIYFLTTDYIHGPKLNVINKSNSLLTQKDGNFVFGKVYKIGDNYYSRGSKKSDVQNIKMALYDENARSLKKSESKIVEDILKDGQFAYFDINSSLDEPMLYVGDKFYDRVNSSVYVDDNDNIYYFRQDGKQRTLYKNKVPLFTLNDWYGFVVDVNSKGEIFFIANSKNGSSLYMYNGSFYRAYDADDIVDAKLLDDDSAIITVVTANGYDYLKIKLQKELKKPYFRHYFFEDDDSFKKIKVDEDNLTTKLDFKKYNSIKNLKYSSLNQAFAVDGSKLSFLIKANFSDPLVKNSADIFLSKDDETLFGVGYKNFEHRLSYGGKIYSVLEKDENISSRSFGLNIFAHYPVYRAGYNSLYFLVDYLLDHDKSKREPLSLSLNFINSKQYGKSMYENESNRASLFISNDRSDFIYGAKYSFLKDIGYQFYGGIDLSYAKSNTNKKKGRYGIKLNDSYFSIGNDPSHFVLRSLDTDIYAKDFFNVGLSLYKVLDFDIYSFTIPVSLRRESIYAKYDYYDLSLLDGVSPSFSQYTFGMSFDTLFIHNNALPFSVEYIYNNKLKDKSKVKVLFDLPL